MEPTVDEILIAVDCAMEQENRHYENTDAWSAVAPFIDPERQLTAAKAYADTVAPGRPGRLGSRKEAVDYGNGATRLPDER